MEFTKDDVARFATKFVKSDESECWEWNAGKFTVGYGMFYVRGWKRPFSAPRVSWMLTTGLDIPTGMMICHTCDNRACVNPGHLYLGTSKDNNTDTINRGRGNRKTGSACSWAKLSEADVLDIRSSKEAQSLLAQRFGIDQSTVSQIRNRLRWKHI